MSRRAVCRVLGLALGIWLLPDGRAPAAAPEAKGPAETLAPTRVTFAARTLTDALRELSKTGMEVVDKRRVRTDPPLGLKFDRTPFWEALDAVARKAGVVVSYYQEGGRLALVDGTYREVPVSYSGPFRT